MLESEQERKCKWPPQGASSPEAWTRGDVHIDPLAPRPLLDTRDWITDLPKHLWKRFNGETCLAGSAFLTFTGESVCKGVAKRRKRDACWLYEREDPLFHPQPLNETVWRVASCCSPGQPRRARPGPIPAPCPVQTR